MSLVILFQVSRPGISLAGLIPASLLKWSEQGAEYAVIVDKSAQKIFLYHRDDPSEPVKEFVCSTGENSGSKSKRNDRKTPDGIYFLTKSYPKRDLSPIYGDMAFPIDYPNALDRKEGKGGYGIWFHGTNEPLKPRDTNGCIVLENESINELAGYVKLHETPVIIIPRMERVLPGDVKHESLALEKVIERWRKAWENKDISQYMSSYSPGFSVRGMDWRRWKAYKEGLAKKYGKIKVEIGDLQLFKANGVVLAKFDQTYRTSRFESRGEKRLYLTKNSKQWKITGEFFEKGKIRNKPFSHGLPKDFPEIKRFVDAWRNAWEQKDFNAYIGVYDREFRSNRMDLRVWKRYKAGLNKRSGSLKIRISRLKIIQHSGHTAQVRFKQEYHADSYEDSGMKDLYLIRRGRDWKIKKEIWRPIVTRNSL